MQIPNPVTRNLPYSAVPWVHPTDFVSPNAILTGDVLLGPDVFVGFGTIIRGDWGPVYIGPLCNLHDYVTIHEQPDLLKQVGPFKFAVHLGREVSVLHKASVHGPCRIGRNTFIGQMANIFDAEIGADCVVMHGAVITGGVKIGDGRLVEAGQVVKTQAEADALEPVPGDLVSLNPRVVQGYYELGKGYRRLLAT